jgi:hypothetical protein
VQLCEAFFGMSDELCKLAMWGRKYAVMLHGVALSSEIAAFRLGGSMHAHVASSRLSCLFSILFLTAWPFPPSTRAVVLEEGLEVVNEIVLPVWLGATEVVLPLYKKVGFKVDRVFEFDMSPYGGEGLTKHVLMIRPAVEKKKC